MKQYSIDTNVLLRYLLDDIPSQTTRIHELLLKAKKGEVRIDVPMLVIAEVFFVLASFYRLQKQNVCAQLADFCKLQYMDIEKREVVLATFALIQLNNIGFIDAFLLAHTREMGSELCTFDKKLKRLAQGR